MQVKLQEEEKDLRALVVLAKAVTLNTFHVNLSILVLIKGPVFEEVAGLFESSRLQR